MATELVTCTGRGRPAPQHLGRWERRRGAAPGREGRPGQHVHRAPGCALRRLLWEPAAAWDVELVAFQGSPCVHAPWEAGSGRRREERPPARGHQAAARGWGPSAVLRLRLLFATESTDALCSPALGRPSVQKPGLCPRLVTEGAVQASCACLFPRPLGLGFPVGVG